MSVKVFSDIQIGMSLASDVSQGDYDGTILVQPTPYQPLIGNSGTGYANIVFDDVVTLAGIRDYDLTNLPTDNFNISKLTAIVVVNTDRTAGHVITCGGGSNAVMAALPMPSRIFHLEIDESFTIDGTHKMFRVSGTGTVSVNFIGR